MDTDRFDLDFLNKEATVTFLSRMYLYHSDCFLCEDGKITKSFKSTDENEK